MCHNVAFAAVLILICSIVATAGFVPVLGTKIATFLTEMITISLTGRGFSVNSFGRKHWQAATDGN